MKPLAKTEMMKFLYQIRQSFGFAERKEIKDKFIAAIDKSINLQAKRPTANSKDDDPLEVYRLIKELIETFLINATDLKDIRSRVFDAKKDSNKGV